MPSHIVVMWEPCEVASCKVTLDNKAREKFYRDNLAQERDRPEF